MATRVLKEPTFVTSWTDWDSVPRVKAALNQLERGHFQSAAMLMDAMGRDDRIRGVLSTRISGLLGLPLQFDPVDAQARSKDFANSLEDDFWTFAPEYVLADLLKSGVMLGIGVAQIIWDRISFAPTIRNWHPRHLRWNTTTETYWIQTNGGEVEIREDDPNWLVYTPYGYRHGWMEGLVRSLAIPFIMRQYAMRDWARNSEVHGLPIRKAMIPPGATTESISQFMSEVATLGNESVIRLPQSPAGEGGFNLELLEAEAQSHEGFRQLIDQCNVAIAIVIVGQNLTTEISKNGSRAAADVHDRVRSDILNFDAETLGTCVREKLLKRIAQFKYGDPEVAPWPSWQTEMVSNGPENAQALASIVKALEGIRNLGVQNVDVARLLEQYNVPTLQGRPAEITPSPPPASQRSADALPPVAPAAGPRTAPALASSRLSEASSAMVAGQLRVDALVDSGVTKAVEKLEPTIKELLTVVEESTDYEEMRRKLLVMYRGTATANFAEIMRKALILAELSGRQAAIEEL